MKPKKHVILGQPSWRLTSSDVELFVTELGGHVGPVTFDRQRRRLEPLHVAPWAREPEAAALPPILRVLRGDFFCLPFGGNATRLGREHHPIHGETANGRWNLVDLTETGGESTLHLRLQTHVRRGQVDKQITLRDGHHAVYSRHLVTGMSGPMCFGHHAMIHFPDRPGSGVISTSPFVLGQVFVEPTERPENRGYSFLKPGAEFASLDAVPTITGDLADLGRFPARRGFEDIVMLVADPDVPFAWTAVVFARERFVWFALKDPRVLRSTVFWLSNGGRHYPPWNGRHLNVMGLEEVTAYFHYGLAESVRLNPLTAKGLATSVQFDPARPYMVNYIMAATGIPRGFDRVKEIVVSADGGGVTLRSFSGFELTTPLDLAFLSHAPPE